MDYFLRFLDGLAETWWKVMKEMIKEKMESYLEGWK